MLSNKVSSLREFAHRGQIRICHPSLINSLWCQQTLITFKSLWVRGNLHYLQATIQEIRNKVHSKADINRSHCCESSWRNGRQKRFTHFVETDCKHWWRYHEGNSCLPSALLCLQYQLQQCDCPAFFHITTQIPSRVWSSASDI